MSDVLERGEVYFFYRPRVESKKEYEEHQEKHEPEASGLQDVEHFYMILSPKKGKTRLCIIGQKKLPDIEDGGQKYWGFVDDVGSKDHIEDDLEAIHYGTETRGQRVDPSARPAGEGVYAIVCHDKDHTHLAYVLELPKHEGAVQKAENIEPEGSYILSIKNPDKPSPPGAGLSSGRKADYPDELEDKFRDRRFIPADPPDFLDYEGCEFLLIGAKEDVSKELGIHLHPQKETRTQAEIFSQLHLEKKKHPTEPLFKGKWE